MFSCEAAARAAFSEAQLLPRDIDWFGLYDCFPICFVRAVEACGLAPPGGGGRWVEEMMARTADGDYAPRDFPVNTHTAAGLKWGRPSLTIAHHEPHWPPASEAAEKVAGAGPENQPSPLSTNRHGGLLAFGAPWEVPAMYNIVEACEQLIGRAGPQRQVEGARRALVYGNGGIFSHSAVAILSAPVD